MSAAAGGIAQQPPDVSGRPMTPEERKVIFASSLGTVFEWYDFYIFGTLAAVVGKQFFAPLSTTAQFIMTLLAFAAGFAVLVVMWIMFAIRLLIVPTAHSQIAAASS